MQTPATIASCNSLAHPSLALIKYWGKSDTSLNLPATPSLAITLDSLYTETNVLLLHTKTGTNIKDQASAGTPQDSVEINGQPQNIMRFNPFFREFRHLVRQSGLKIPAFSVAVRSHSNFASSAGLASSSSGFSALALACCRAAGLKLADSELSALARVGSASAARSLWGGFTRLDAGSSSAESLYPANWWPELRVIVLQVDSRAKGISSRLAMEITRKTSPFYAAWLSDAPKIMNHALAALAERKLQVLGPLIRESYLRMFSTMFSARPPIIYWKPESLAILKLCEELRANSVEVWETMDAGPQVKLFCRAGDVERILDVVGGRLPGLDSFVCCAGEGARVMALEEYRP